MTRNSIVLRLSASFAITTFVLVGLGSAYLHRSLERILMREGEDDLRRAASEILRGLEEGGAYPSGPLNGIEGRVLDRSARTLWQTPGMPMFATPPGATSAPAMIESRPNQFMVLVVRSPQGWIEVGRDLSPEARRLARFTGVLWATLVSTTLAAAVVGLWISRRGLLPLRHLADQAREIHPEALATRLHLDGTPSELVPLVEALNGSLSRLETAFSRLAALNADMAHELRTPVHSLLLEAERLLSRRDLSPELEEGLSGMMETLDHLGAMIGQMLFLARIEDPGAVVVKGELSAEDLLRSASEPFGPLAEDAGVRLSVAAPPDMTLSGDGTLLRRALHNLVDNAIRHAPSGSTVTVQAWESPGASILSVSDEGAGIPETYRQNLGQRFLRSDPSRSRGTGGSGLGLAIVHSIMNLHGGRLEIRSEPEAGTVVNLVLLRT